MPGWHVPVGCGLHKTDKTTSWYARPMCLMEVWTVESEHTLHQRVLLSLLGAFLKSSGYRRGYMHMKQGPDGERNKRCFFFFGFQ